MIRSWRLASWRLLGGTALILVTGGCTSQQTGSLEDALWKVFAGHPKPEIYKEPPAPVFCYGTLGDATCYDEPRPGEKLLAHPFMD